MTVPSSLDERERLARQCDERAGAAEKEAADARRYAAWQRSAEGQRHRDEWVGGGPESGDDDDAAYTAEAADQRAIAALLRSRQTNDGPTA